MDADSIISIIQMTMEAAGTAGSLIRDLSKTPRVVLEAQPLLSETQHQLVALNHCIRGLAQDRHFQQKYGQPVKNLQIDRLLRSTQGVCHELHGAIAKSTRHSKGGLFSKRDRVLVNFDEKKFLSLTQRLRDCRGAINMTLTSLST